MSENRSFRICLTGHRPKDVTQFIESGNIYDMHNPYWVQVINCLYHIIANELRKHPEGLELHSGLALGADTAWGAAILIAKKRFGRRIQFVADCPLPTQASHWAPDSQRIWQILIDSADRVDYTTTGAYTPNIMEERNLQMILPSDLCIAFWSGKQHGGTYNGVQDAKQHGVPILRVDPAQFATK